MPDLQRFAGAGVALAERGDCHHRGMIDQAQVAAIEHHLLRVALRIEQVVKVCDRGEEQRAVQRVGL
jgi:hypothetical protein